MTFIHRCLRRHTLLHQIIATQPIPYKSISHLQLLSPPQHTSRTPARLLRPLPPSKPHTKIRLLTSSCLSQPISRLLSFLHKSPFLLFLTLFLLLVYEAQLVFVVNLLAPFLLSFLLIFHTTPCIMACCSPHFRMLYGLMLPGMVVLEELGVLRLWMVVRSRFFIVLSLLIVISFRIDLDDFIFILIDLILIINGLHIFLSVHNLPLVRFQLSPPPLAACLSAPQPTLIRDKLIGMEQHVLQGLLVGLLRWVLGLQRRRAGSEVIAALFVIVSVLAHLARTHSSLLTLSHLLTFLTLLCLLNIILLLVTILALIWVHIALDMILLYIILRHLPMHLIDWPCLLPLPLIRQSLQPASIHRIVSLA